MDRTEQIEMAKAFLARHRGPPVLLLPNAWDPMSARLFVTAGFDALATTSGGVAWALGYADGEQVPWDGIRGGDRAHRAHGASPGHGRHRGWLRRDAGRSRRAHRRDHSRRGGRRQSGGWTSRPNPHRGRCGRAAAGCPGGGARGGRADRAERALRYLPSPVRRGKHALRRNGRALQGIPRRGRGLRLSVRSARPGGDRRLRQGGRRSGQHHRPGRHARRGDIRTHGGGADHHRIGADAGSNVGYPEARGRAARHRQL